MELRGAVHLDQMQPQLTAISALKSDGYFPVASTCFFSLALPKYTCAAACAAKLKYAIKHAHLMDADFLLRHADGWEAVRS